MKIKMDIIGYEDLYTIDEQGNIYGKTKKKFLKPWIHKDGYLQLRLCKNSKKNSYLIHRLIAIHFIPNSKNLPCIDHKNGIKSDNRIENLRWVNNSQNGMNKEKNKNNKSGYKGVCFNKKLNKYVAQIKINYKVLHIGYYDTALEASQAYEEKAKEVFGEFKREIN